MNADRTFWIGKDHNICEDFALAEVDNIGIAYAIVSDGCSASKEVDFGARVMAMAAKQSLRLGGHTLSPPDFGNDVISNAKRAVRQFPYLSLQCLDATLLAAWVKDGIVTVNMFGDGVFIHRMNTGVVNSVHIHLTSNAPDYLSYNLDPLRRQAYDKLVDNKKEVTIRMGTQGMVVKTTALKPFEPYTLTVPVEAGDVLAVVSDGINSFRKSDYTPIPWEELIDEFTGFKNFEGEFVLRRVSAFKRKCLKEGITHSDDISVAAILV